MIREKFLGGVGPRRKASDGEMVGTEAIARRNAVQSFCSSIRKAGSCFLRILMSLCTSF